MCAIRFALSVLLITIPTASAQSDTDVANCVFDTILATSFLAKASFQIMEAIVECPSNDAGCTSEISKATSSFLLTGSFISAAANECGAIADTNAACASAVIGLLANLAGVSGATSSMVNTCVKIGEGQTRRLYGQAPQILGKCIVNTFISTNLLGKAGLQITAATKDCPVQDTQNQKAACSADVSGVIASFGVVASFLSKAASQCAETAEIRALCSGDAAGLISALAGLAQTGSAMVNACPQPTRRLQEELLAEMNNNTFRQHPKTIFT